jgi:hypothetical protein
LQREKLEDFRFAKLEFWIARAAGMTKPGGSAVEMTDFLPELRGKPQPQHNKDNALLAQIRAYETEKIIHGV